ncbi:WcbI family polysaccharide biosynthesis putative acetyltransferase [Paraglaciecola sp. L3A3]|uniref:WcbI family polysaccharide biosynthesis putative acetyltransferase n=1 Tax=Paraglaciecola sp. L3A3 TaxID=2686358 RepID=UPI00131DC796|nr:WcbI family polysaccharide biosynthesis putative acetyltransferase [Paraglaciecola sp. L3A3]
MRIVIVGNCQARPLKEIIEALGNDVTVISTPIVHLLKDEDEQSIDADMIEADIIVTQLIADNYPCKFIQTNKLKQKYPNKIVTILNLFYSGYTPDWMYIRVPGKNTLKGPMGDYHNSTIVDSWLAGRTIHETAERLFDKQYNYDRYNKDVILSMNELSSREENVDVKIVDFIQSNLTSKRLFFTFNHPCLFLLVEYAMRILKKIGYPENLDSSNLQMNEPLSQFIPPLNSGVDFDFPVVKEFKGLEIAAIDGSEITTAGEKFYSPSEIVELYFSIYAENEDVIRSKYGA